LLAVILNAYAPLRSEIFWGSTMIVDFHTHIFSSEVIENRSRFVDDRNFNILYSDEKARLIDHRLLLQAMDSSHIDCAVALGYPWEKEEYYELQNQYFKRVMELSKGRIYPFATIPMIDERNIDGYVKGIKDMGLCGIGEVGFYSSGFSRREEKILSRLFESALKYSLPVSLHVNESVGHEYVGKYETDFRRLYAILHEFRGLTVILAHWGGGMLFYELMPEVRESFANVYYDTAASPFLYRDEVYDIAARIVGSEKILFGTDYPLINYSRYVQSIERIITDENDRENILGANAMRILK
jgi:predicted TIM-barrel fold metal-dependent hydrolase